MFEAIAYLFTEGELGDPDVEGSEEVMDLDDDKAEDHERLLADEDGIDYNNNQT